MVLIGFRLFGPPLAGSLGRAVAGSPAVPVEPPHRPIRWIVDRVRAHVKPGERLLYEEGGKSLPGYPDIFHGDRYSGLLPYLTRVEMLGGPFLRVLVKANFTQFGEGRLFGESDWGRDHFVRYARLYRPAAILCWSGHARGFCRANPDLVEVVEDDGTLLAGTGQGIRAGTRSWGRPRSRPSRAGSMVERATPGVDGTVVLRYHSVPCLRTRPEVAWDSVYLESDPVPFIRLRPPLPRVTPGAGVPPRHRAKPAGRPDPSGAATIDRILLQRTEISVARPPGKESAVAAEPTGAVLDFDRHFRRAVWITTLCVIIGAGIVYAGKAADDRSAFIRWRHQVLQFWSGENIYDAMMFPNPPIMPLTLLPFMLLQPVPGRSAGSP